jgi:hypothetical protein
MRRLRRAHQRQTRQNNRFKRRAVAAGTAAVITLGGLSINKALAANVADKHQLVVSQDADGDLLADKEELAMGYNPGRADENGNGILDGVELARRCEAVIAQLPWKEDATDPDQTYKWHAPQWGLETCDICGQTVNMGPAGIVNPKLGLEVECPLIAMHYMEHGSFSYAGDVYNGRVDVAALVQALELPVPNALDEHQLPVAGDADVDLLTNKEEITVGYRPFNGDQNRNGIPDGVELAKRCEEVIAQLPWKEDVTDPDQTYKWHTPQFGLETCDVCGETVNMGPAGIVNPKLALEVDCPLIAMHYMEHGSFSYGGDVYNGRIDVAALMRALELRFPCHPNEHQLPLTESDLDGDLLTDKEELAAGYNLHDADQDNDLTPDGIELAKQCAEVIDALPVYEPDTPGVNEPYKVSFIQRGLEFCDICGESVNMGYWQVVNPTLGLSLDVPDIVCHYMQHGSFSYAGDLHGKGRTDVALLAKILEMPRRCGHLGTVYAPGDLNHDCKNDLADLAKLAEKWLDSTEPNKGQQKK